jgi:hypothetical protein
VNDVVNINDGVFVKVIDISVEKTTTTDHVEAGTKTSDSRNNNNANCKVRHKIKLSMKYVNQDNGLDLDISNDQLANDMLLSHQSGSNNNNTRTNNDGGGGDANSQLERALASNMVSVLPLILEI